MAFIDMFFFVFEKLQLKIEYREKLVGLVQDITKKNSRSCHDGNSFQIFKSNWKRKRENVMVESEIYFFLIISVFFKRATSRLFMVF